jgi:hypothetical protein
MTESDKSTKDFKPEPSISIGKWSYGSVTLAKTTGTATPAESKNLNSSRSNIYLTELPKGETGPADK